MMAIYCRCSYFRPSSEQGTIILRVFPFVSLVTKHRDLRDDLKICLVLWVICSAGRSLRLPPVVPMLNLEVSILRFVGNGESNTYVWSVGGVPKL